MKSLYLIIMALLWAASPSMAAILVQSPLGGLPSVALTLSAANIAANDGKTIVITSALTAAQSNVGSAIRSNIALKLENGGSINNTTALTISGPVIFAGGKFGGSVNLAINGAITAAPMGQIFAGTGYVTLGSGSTPVVYPEWWGAKGDDATDDSYSFNESFKQNKPVQLSNKIYKINAVTPGGTENGLILRGAGSRSTVLKCFNPSIAAITFNYTTTWAYESIIQDIKFMGVRTYLGAGLGYSSSGVGFTFGATNPANFVMGMQNYCGTTFRNCFFFGLDKGVQFPYGNIGTSFYDCCFTGCKYGVYSINARYGGLQQSGCKYFYSSQFDNNEVAIYAWDDYADAGQYVNGIDTGAYSFTNTILEYNQIAMYVYNHGTMHSPIRFDGIWLENNGATMAGIASPPPASVTLDTWNGTIKSTATVPNRTFIFGGTSGLYTFNGGAFTDCNVTGSNIIVNVTNAACTGSPYPSTVSNTTSIINMINPTMAGELPRGARQITTGKPFPLQLTTLASAGWYFTEARTARGAYGAAKKASVPFTSGTNLGGSWGVGGLAGSVVSDGIIYPTVNEYTVPAFSSSMRFDVNASTITTSPVGWYVYTVDISVLYGNPQFFWYDGSSFVMSGPISIPELYAWHTVAGIVESNSTHTVTFSIGGTPAAESTKWRMSALQMLRFDTREKAASFLAGRGFAE